MSPRVEGSEVTTPERHGEERGDAPRSWVLPVGEVYAALESSERGLDPDEAAQRLERFGPNRVRPPVRARALPILLHQFQSPLVYILLLAMAISVAIAHWEDVIVIAIVLVLNATIGFTQEHRAESAIAALMRMISTRASVMRRGARMEIDAVELVPGDLVWIESGDIIPADLRLVDASRLECNEALLTGESMPVGKIADPLSGDAIPPVAERANMAYGGAAVTTGRGRGLVVATGAATEIGGIAEEIQGVARAETPLQRRMARLGRRIGMAIVLLSLFAFTLGLLRGEPMARMFLTAVAIAVAAIPEGLPVVMTIALAVSVRRMARRNAIVRHLPAVETLGSCTVIVTDKTGTLTENQLTVRELDVGGLRYRVTGGGLDPRGQIRIDENTVEIDAEPVLSLLLTAGALCNEADVQPSEVRFRARGDPTDVALLVAAAKGGLDRDALRERYPEIADVPFEPARQFAATVRRETGTGEPVVFVKGAPERVVAMCDRVMSEQGTRALDPEDVLRRTNILAEEGLRVLALATGRGPAVGSVLEDAPAGLVFLGLIGMLDPPREDARAAIAECASAGIEVKMVTGDHAATARSVAALVGLAGPEARVVAGAELADLTDASLRELLRDVKIFARTTPAQKLRIVEALREMGHVVAVTGDGVNDAPALKSAHVGAAMGRSGTDVAREASEIVLTDDRFATIGAAVEEGRVAFSNIRKATLFLVSSGLAELMAILGSLFLGLRLPFLPAQILWLNVVTNGVEHVGLAMEPAEEDERRRAPRHPDEGMLTPLLLERVGVAGGVMAAGTLTVFWLEGGARPESLGYAQVAALTTMVMFQALHVANCRSERRSIFSMRPFSNPFLFFGVSGSVLLHVGALYFGPTQRLLQLQPLEPETWARIGAIALSILLAIELHKLLRRGTAIAAGPWPPSRDGPGGSDPAARARGRRP